MKVSYRDQFGNWKLADRTIDYMEIELDFSRVSTEYNEETKTLIIRELGGK